MTAVLITLAEMQRFLDVDDDGDVIQEVLDHVEGLFLQQCGRRLRPFIATADGRTEVKSGTGSCELVLDYPIDDITSIKISADSDFSDPDESLDPDDADEVRWTVGERTIYRADGGTFGNAGERRVVQVVYDHAADKPDAAKLAVKRATAMIYRQRGTEDAARYSLSGYSQDQAKFGRDFVDDDPIWKMAVDALQEVRA